MEFEPDISKLENIVNRLLNEYDGLKSKYEQLTINLAEAIAQVEDLKTENMTLVTEKDSVHSQVALILGKLTEWEDGLDGKVSDEKVEAPQDSGGQLFSMGDSSA